MSAGPTTTEELIECPICQHSGPPTCVQCGGINGVPGIPPCLRCKARGGVPTDSIEATEPRQLPPDPITQQVINRAAYYDDTV